MLLRRAFGWLRRAFGPIPRSPQPRLPLDAVEDARVHGRWDSLNGRYYFVADVALAGGTVCRDVTFDADTNVAVRVGGGRIPADLFGQPVAAWLVVRDRAGRLVASGEERAAFARAHGRSAG